MIQRTKYLETIREWQEEFVSTLLERDMPQLGITIPAAALGDSG